MPLPQGPPSADADRFPELNPELDRIITFAFRRGQDCERRLTEIQTCALCKGLMDATCEVDGFPLCHDHRRLAAMKHFGLTEADLR